MLEFVSGAQNTFALGGHPHPIDLRFFVSIGFMGEMRLAVRQTAEAMPAPLGIVEVFNISSSRLWPGVRLIPNFGISG